MSKIRRPAANLGQPRPTLVVVLRASDGRVQSSSTLSSRRAAGVGQTSLTSSSRRPVMAQFCGRRRLLVLGACWGCRPAAWRPGGCARGLAGQKVYPHLRIQLGAVLDTSARSLLGLQASSLEAWRLCSGPGRPEVYPHLRVQLWVLLDTSARGLLGLQASGLEVWRLLIGGLLIVEC